jgi:hypothetical protein
MTCEICRTLFLFHVEVTHVFFLSWRQSIDFEIISLYIRLIASRDAFHFGCYSGINGLFHS